MAVFPIGACTEQAYITASLEEACDPGNACCGIEPERFTVPNTNYLFATDTRGTKAIATSRVE